MLTFVHDAPYAFRLLLKRPSFSAVAILTLALGIGATTAIFTVVNAVLLSPLPFADPGRLLEISITGREGRHFPLSDVDVIAWREQNATASAVAVFDTNAVNLTGGAAPERVIAADVTDRFFEVLGVRPAIGAAFDVGDDKPGAPKNVVLSHAFWQRRFQGDAGIVGKTISLAATSHTVVGVMPPDFNFPERVDVWRTLTMSPPPRRGPFYSSGIARMKPRVTIDEVRANLDRIAAGVNRQHPAAGAWRYDPVPLQEALVGNVRRILYVLLGAVGFLLLIATANVANLLLSRAASREREIAVRGALGAGRARIVSQLVTESVVLAACAGVLGLLLAAWGTKAMLAMAPDGIPRLQEVGMNVPVFLFALAASTACGVLFGIVPALRMSETPLVETLKEGGRSGTAGVGHRRMQRLLVVAEIALALVLSVGAGLMIRSFAELQRVSPGFDPGHLFIFEISLPRAQYGDAPKVRAFYDTLLQRLEELPGVRSAATTVSLPPDWLQVTDNFMVEGMVLPPNQNAPLGPIVMVSDAYFKTLGVPLLRGRFFDERDEAGREPTVIVNETLAKKYFAGVDPIGRHLKDGGPERPVGPNNPWMTVVGVVGDIKYSGLDAPVDPTFYMPYRQNAWTREFVVVRTVSDPRGVMAAVHGVVAGVDKDVPVALLKTMDEMMEASVAPPRFRTVLVTTFALVGLLLAAIGIYGVMAYAVAARTHELGVRIALGADRSAVLRLVLGETIVLAAIGIAAGLAGAFAATRLIQGLLFGVTSTDAVTFTGISVLLVVTALVASYVPARRAIRVDPMIALRYE